MTDTIAAVARPAAPTDTNLRFALLDSRQRWRDLVLTAADLVYETDAWGRFVFIMPDPALGWSVATLIDQPAELLLAGGIGANGFDPFRVTTPVRRRRAWLQQSDGSPLLLAISAAPLIDAEGHVVGTRGMGIDWSEFDDDAARVAASLRRGEVLDHILWRMGGEVMRRG